ncbi:MAG: hypothetical protein IJ515_07225 [Clostridia bacterium]|nr:hypothetical protein [Clostridia bacterium]
MKKLLAILLTLTTLLFSLAACQDNNSDDPTPEINLVSEADHDAVVAKMLTGEIEVAVLPEPKATVAVLNAKQNGHSYSVKLNISNEWSSVSENELAMGCIAVRNDFITSYEASLVDFLAEYKASIEYIGNKSNAESSAQMIVDAGVLPKLPVAKSALNNLYGAIVYQDGAEMKATLKDFYSAISLTQPADAFYYIPDSTAQNTVDRKIVIGIMNGPTGMGMAKLISDYGKENDKYEFVMYSDPSLATADLNNGEIDMACLPTNTVANLANKGSQISVASINCLGSLYVVAKDGIEINSVADLCGKNVYYGVPNSTTAPILRYIFGKHNIATKES